MIASLREFLLLLRAAQTRLAVDWCHWRLERARRELADAHDAHDRARAELRLHYTPPSPPSIPAFLAVGNVQPIRKGKKA